MSSTINKSEKSVRNTLFYFFLLRHRLYFLTDFNDFCFDMDETVTYENNLFSFLDLLI